MLCLSRSFVYLVCILKQEYKLQIITSNIGLFINIQSQVYFKTLYGRNTTYKISYLCNISLINFCTLKSLIHISIYSGF